MDGWLITEVDNLLVPAEDELELRTGKYSSCQENRIQLSREKVKIGKGIVFVGILLVIG